jgi:hypothetical protein
MSNVEDLHMTSSKRAYCVIGRPDLTEAASDILGSVRFQKNVIVCDSACRCFHSLLSHVTLSSLYSYSGNHTWMHGRHAGRFDWHSLTFIKTMLLSLRNCDETLCIAKQKQYRGRHSWVLFRPNSGLRLHGFEQGLHMSGVQNI